MSSLLKNSELTSEKADSIVSETLNNCDDGELYIEDTKSETIVLDDNKIKSSNYTSDLGYGFRAVTGDTVAYSHSNEISEKSLNYQSDGSRNGPRGRKPAQIRFRMGVQFWIPFWNHFRKDFKRKPLIVRAASTLLNLIEINVPAFTAFLGEDGHEIGFGSNFEAKLAPILA